MKLSLLNLGSGKIDPSEFSDYGFVVHVDRSYLAGYNDDLNSIELYHSAWFEKPNDGELHVSYSPLEVFDFLDSYKFKFDHINADRIFEHMFYDSGEIGRLLDACNQITKDTGTMDIIVPDTSKIVQLLMAFENEYDNMPSQKIDSFKLLINTELMNTRSDAHGSAWTPKLAQSYIEAEGGTWQIDSIEQNVSHKGRNLYMRIQCSKPGANRKCLKKKQTGKPCCS